MSTPNNPNIPHRIFTAADFVSTPPMASLHIQCDSSLSPDDSDELVVHLLPEGRIMLEIYQGPGLGTHRVQTVLEPIAAMQLKELLRDRMP